MQRKSMLYLYNTNIKDNSAAVNQMFNTMSALANHFQLTYLCPWHSAPTLHDKLSDLNLPENFRVKQIPVPAVHNELVLKISRFFYSLYAYIYLRRSRFRYIYTRDFAVIYFFSLLAKKLKPTTELIFEAHKVYYRTSKLVNYKQEKKAYSIVNRVVATSNNCKNDLHHLFNIDTEKILVTPNGVNLDYYREEMARYKKRDFADPDKILVYSGSFIWWKGVDTLLKAFPLTTTKNIKLLLVGDYGNCKTKIRNLIIRNKLEDKIIMKGYLPQGKMIELLCSAHLGIIPNNKSTEGILYTSPVKLFEYMACGLPIVASALPSIKELVTEGRNCLFFQPEDETDLAAKIDFLLKHRDLMQKMANHNWQDVEKYTWQEKAQSIADFLV